MIHIVFQEADVETLQKSFALDKSLEGDLMLIRDDYAVGPLQALYTPEGIGARRLWWQEVLAGSEYDALTESGKTDDPQTVADLTARLQHAPEETVWIWAAQNKHDVSGYYWLVSQLTEFAGRIFILYLNNLPFISEKGTIFYPVNLFQIPPREFLKAKKLARPVTPGEFESDSDEWVRLCGEDKKVRLLEGGKKLVQYREDFYDQELLGFVQPGWQKASKVMSQFMQKARHTTGDEFLRWRLKHLIATGRIEYQGELKSLRDFEVKQVLAEPAELPFEQG